MFTVSFIKHISDSRLSVQHPKFSKQLRKDYLQSSTSFTLIVSDCI